MAKEIDVSAHTVIRAEYAWLASKFIASDETRYYLRGVFVEAHPEGGAYVVATDGHSMAVFRDKAAVVQKTCIVTIPTEMQQIMEKPRKSTYSLWSLTEDIKCAVDHDAETVTLGRIGQDAPTLLTPFATSHGAIIDGQYPNWKKAIPQGVTEVSARAVVNGRILSRFTEVAKTVGSHGAIRVLADSVDAPIVVTAGRDDFFGVIMPLRDSSEVVSKTPAGLPGWFPVASATAPPQLDTPSK